MAVQRKMNWLGQERVEVSHLRMVESAVAGDFDALAGILIGNGKPYVVRGFSVPPGIGQRATSLLLKVGGAAFVNRTASESGSLFYLDPTAADEVLSPANSRLVGGFVPGTTNFVSLDVVSIADPASVDQVKFKDALTGQEFTSSVPVSRVIDWRVFVSASPFSNSPGRLPIAKVVTDASNAVVSVTDARPMLWRLAVGGDSPSAATYTLSTENANTSTSSGSDPFIGGDKTPGSLKEWMDAVMTKLWNASGGQYWYSATTGNQYKMARSGSPFPNGEHFSWAEPNLKWKGVAVLFEGGSNGAYYNTVTDSSDTGVALAVGEGLVVDLDFSQNATTAARVESLASFSGRGVILAWRNVNGVYTRDQPFSVNTNATGEATTSALGTVRLMSAAIGALAVPVADNTSGNATYRSVIAAGVSRGGAGGIVAGVLSVGHGANDSGVEIGRESTTTTVMGALVAAAGLSVTGTASVTSLSATGAIAGASLDVAGAITGASATITGAVATGTLTTTGALTAGASGVIHALLGKLDVGASITGGRSEVEFSGLQTGNVLGTLGAYISTTGADTSMVLLGNKAAGSTITGADLILMSKNIRTAGSVLQFYNGVASDELLSLDYAGNLKVKGTFARTVLSIGLTGTILQNKGGLAFTVDHLSTGTYQINNASITADSMFLVTINTTSDAIPRFVAGAGFVQVIITDHLAAARDANFVLMWL